MHLQKQFNLEMLANHTNCQLVGNPKHLISGIADLEMATSQDASFFSNNPRYLKTLESSEAGVIFVDHQTLLKENKNYLISDQPSQAFQKVIDIFHPPRQSPSGFQGIHPTAVIHETALLGEGVSIGPYSVIDERVKIGNETFIGAGTYIGPDSIIGDFCLIHPRVVIREECQIGNKVIIQPGAVIGSCGFGYTTDLQGQHTKLNQVGGVLIRDNVEIGANATIDRARFKNTIIGEGSKIDNLVQLGHGVHLGNNNLIVAQTGIAGSSSTGNSVFLGGQVAVAGHLTIQGGTQVAGKSGVTKSLDSGQYGGFPASPLHQHNRNQVFLRNIEKHIDLIKDLVKRVQTLEHKIQTPKNKSAKS